MRTFLFIFAFVSALTVSAQDSLLTFERVVEQKGTQLDLAKRARRWFGENVKSSKESLQVTDIKNGELMGIVQFTYSAQLKVIGKSVPTTGTISAKVFIWTKDNRYRYRISPFTIENINADAASFPVTTSKVHPSVSRGKFSDRQKAGLNAWWHDVQRQCSQVGGDLAASIEAQLSKGDTW